MITRVTGWERLDGQLWIFHKLLIMSLLKKDSALKEGKRQLSLEELRGSDETDLPRFNRLPHICWPVVTSCPCSLLRVSVAQ